jgi:hypothetical protein
VACGVDHQDANLDEDLEDQWRISGAWVIGSIMTDFITICRLWRCDDQDVEGKTECARPVLGKEELSLAILIISSFPLSAYRNSIYSLNGCSPYLNKC